MLYLILMNILGYYSATALFIAGVMFLLGCRDKKTLILIPLGFDLFVFLVFARILAINFPKGILF